MIKFEMFKNDEHNSCSFCGETHKEMIQMQEDGESYHFIMSRKCAKSFMNQLKNFIKLNPSGV